MEGAEDDAGAATGSRGATPARERAPGALGGGEDGGAGPAAARDAADAAAASEAASMSEYDGDSVPSPSQDLNTSTEALLDMIDEIVDGPDAVKRRSSSADIPDPTETGDATEGCAKDDQEKITERQPLPPSPAKSEQEQVTEPQPSSPVATESANCEFIPPECTAKPQVELTTQSDVAENESKQESVESTQACSVPSSEAAESSMPQDSAVINTEPEVPTDCPPSEVLDTGPETSNICPPTNSAVVSVEPEAPNDSPQSNSAAINAEPEASSSACPPSNIPSSSAVETVQCVSDTSETVTCERTVKSVSSSDSQDNVTESAEPTSSDSGVSESSRLVAEPSTRSPLRRRLVRPSLSDRRPDSTVSSTVDSQTVNVHTTGHAASETIAKDVSSSSDAVPSVHGNTKPEEIRNVSEISVCKAETSMSPPKKIKLVRQKLAPVPISRQIVTENTSEREQCQSTSSESLPLVMPDLNTSSVTEVMKPDEDTNVVPTEQSVTPSPEITTDCTEVKPEVSEENISDTKCIVPSSQTEREDSNEMKVPPIKLNFTGSITEIATNKTKVEEEQQSSSSSVCQENAVDSAKPVPKLTIKLGNKQPEEIKSTIPKLTIKPIRPPDDEHESEKPTEQIPSVTKINIKPVIKPPEKINDVHRKSSSSEISESESSENDESNSTSDQASTSDHGPSDVVPKVTIKLGKPGTESEGKFYTEQNAPKITIKGIQSGVTDEQESVSKLTLVISQPEDKLSEKLPKLTIKTVAKSEGQPLSPKSPKLTIKPLKPPEEANKEGSSHLPEITNDIKENTHMPKITIKPVIKSDLDNMPKTPRKSTLESSTSEHIPVVTKLNIKPIVKPKDIAESLDISEEKVPVVSKLNIKPILKPTESTHTVESEDRPVVPKLHIKPIMKPVDVDKTEKNYDNVPVVTKLNIKPILKPSEETPECSSDKVPVVSKLNIKPIIKPKDNDIESSIHNVPKITKLNIKPIRNPEEMSLEDKHCDLNADKEPNCIPVVTKLNIKPVVKPAEEDTKDSENQSSETGNSSDENSDIPVVTKINIKPILRPNESLGPQHEESIPVVTKLNIKPLIKPEETPSSPKREGLRSDSKTSAPVVTKLNIKPVIKPDERELQRTKNDNEDISPKNPPLLVKINMKAMADGSNTDTKTNSVEDNRQHLHNNISEIVPVVTKINIKHVTKQTDMAPLEVPMQSTGKVVNCVPTSSQTQKSSISEALKQNYSPDKAQSLKETITTEDDKLRVNAVSGHKEASQNAVVETKVNKAGHINEANTNVNVNKTTATESSIHTSSRQTTSVQNCTLLKKLLETKKDGLDTRLEENIVPNHLPVQRIETDLESNKEPFSHGQSKSEDTKSEDSFPKEVIKNRDSVDNIPQITIKNQDNLTKPLEINTSDRSTNLSSGQDSPRIILKINKTDHGSSAKIITEETKRPDSPNQNEVSENTHEMVNDKIATKKTVNRKKLISESTPDISVGKRLRSSRIVETPENIKKSAIARRNATKRTSTTEEVTPQSKEPELTVLETKRIKLGQLLSNKSLTVTPIKAKPLDLQVTKSSLEIKQGGKIINHTLLNNDNCAKNGNSKLHNILSNLQAKQAQALSKNEINCSENKGLTAELESNTSTNSSDVVEVPITNSHSDVATLIITDSSESRDFIVPNEGSQDPLEVTIAKSNNDEAQRPESPTILRPESPTILRPESPAIVRPVEMTPQPKKRGRPRKLPVSEGAKPLPAPEAKPLPVPALEERPQRSLRLSRDRPAILAKPRGRGRGRGRGGRHAEPPPPPPEPPVSPEPEPAPEPARLLEEDPTSSRIKLPRMTEALDMCATPLSSRRRESTTPELKVVLEDTLKLESPETPSGRGGRGGRGARGGRGGRGRTPKGRGRGRGGGRGAVYMKETMGIYGRVCGPATTTVQLFEEETCMMDDNATPAKPSHLLDEDSQSSFQSSTNESSKMKKSKFDDLFDSNKIWTAADVKEYVWPPPEKPDVERQVMMIQEQVAMFLGVKGFKRRYPELKRRPVAGDEREYVLSKGLVSEPLCDLGITAVDASEVLDIMLSDYPHKYEEYRSHQRKRQLAAAQEEAQEKPEVRVDRVEMKIESKPEAKPEPSKVDLEKTRQEMVAAAMASASEFNTRLNALRRPACVDMQSYTVQRRRPPPPAPRVHVMPPAGFYPHALLPGQYQHTYRVYTPEQLRYFPLNTALAAPPAPASPPPSSSDSEGDWPSDCSSDRSSDRPAKRKKLTKTKRSSQVDSGVKEEPGEVELCRVCNLRLEANRRYTHERFLVCASCNAKLHPSCLELNADTIRKCREYPWQCAECKTCCACSLPADDDKMLFCDLCDRGFHIYCVGLDKVPSGRWHCVECAVCKSCGARDPNGPPAGTPGTPGPSAGAPGPPGSSAATPGPPGSSAGTPGPPGTPAGSVSVAGGGQWHHQTKRGPGGHKVYSHSLCTPCARAYRIGRYCPLCDRSFIGPKGTMQLVICKLCDRQLHQECVRQTVSQLNVLDYTCGECRRGGITSRAAAVRLAPRTIATLFMAKRRFNKYAHKQYMQSRQGPPKVETGENSNDGVVEPEAESCDLVLSETEMECVETEAEGAEEGVEASDPLEGAGDPAPPLDEAAAAVEALRMDFGD